jgi:NADH:ubiquinone reductase (non-electrogenic)
MLKSSVKEVTSTDMTLNDGTVIPYGIAVWAAGIGPLPLTLDLIKNVAEQNLDSKARGRLVCDRCLRVHGC